jgi:cAMP-specific phosphodiesterase 4
MDEGILTSSCVSEEWELEGGSEEEDEALRRLPVDLGSRLSLAVAELQKATTTYGSELSAMPELLRAMREVIEAAQAPSPASRVSQIESDLISTTLANYESSKLLSKFFAERGGLIRKQFSSLGVVLRSASVPVGRRRATSAADQLSPRHKKIDSIGGVMPYICDLRAKSLTFGSDQSLKVLMEQETKSDVIEILENSLVWEWDVFRFSQVCDNKPLSVYMMFLYHHFNIEFQFPIEEEVFHAYFLLIEQSYQRVPYHNCIHAADVAQSVAFFLEKTKLASWIKPDDLLALLISAAIHDVDHPGRSNSFEIERRSDLAILYNDQSVLENHHVSLAFQLMKSTKEVDIFRRFSNARFKSIRETIISLVLATDMKSHFHVTAKLQAAFESDKKADTQTEIMDKENRVLLLQACLHAADIVAPCRPFDTFWNWTERLEKEWFEQGDEEKKLGAPVSSSMDRTNPSTEESQLAFCSYIVQPLYENWNGMTGNQLKDNAIRYLNQNIAHLKAKVDKKKNLN